jgi:hypothetical protein
VHRKRDLLALGLTFSAKTEDLTDGPVRKDLRQMKDHKDSLLLKPLFFPLCSCRD